MGTRGIMPEKRKSPVKKIVLFSLLGVLAILIAVGAYFYFDITAEIDGENVRDEFVSFSVERGDGLNSVSNRLAEMGIIEYPFFFRLYGSMNGMGSKIIENDYDLRKGASYEEIFAAITTPRKARPSVRITFPEGTEVTDIIEKFLAVGAEKGAAWSREGFNAALLAEYECSYIPAVSALPEGVPVYARLEGFLYPDTYDFYLDSTEQELFAKMVAQFIKKAETAGLAQKAQAAGVSVYDAMILGSIIQKESGNVADFALISSVFNNRLEIDMKLQSDATVSYMIPKEERLASCTSAQLNTDTPYNVYMHKGLSPTPICCARIEASVAACEPQESDYLYFIGTPDGVTIFAETFKEHQANVNKYLK